MDTLKEKIHQKCVEVIDQKIAMHQKAMNDAQDAANKEQRSTAGDKYDTSRAMSQNERDMYAGRLSEVLQMKKVLNNIDPKKIPEQIEIGTLVSTNSANYYLSVSCGKISIDGTDYFAISPITPAGQAMLGKSAGEMLDIMGQTVKIKLIV